MYFNNIIKKIKLMISSSDMMFSKYLGTFLLNHTLNIKSVAINKPTLLIIIQILTSTFLNCELKDNLCLDNI